MQEQVFINYAPEDFPLAEEIIKRLELAGLPYYIPPTLLDPVTQNEMVEKIKSIATAHGCMLCILSNRAIKNSLFISNIQLMCESARTNRILVNYQVEQLENDHSIRLFTTQAYQVIKSGHPAKDISRIIQRIHQIIHPPARNIFQFLSRHISRKVLIRLFSIALLLGVGGSILFNALQPASTGPILPNSTPVVIYVPFSGQSQDAGLTVDAPYIPIYKPDSDPAVEAPFSFKPDTILWQEDFNDPNFNDTYNAQRWNINNTWLDNISSIAVNQSNGVLQVAVAPVGDHPITLDLNSKYLFNPNQLTYLGYRFRLEDYQGTILENTTFNGSFYYQTVNGQWTPNIDFNGVSQKLFFNGLDIPLGTRWHTVEMLSQKDKHFVDIYLDGTKIRTLWFDDKRLVRWTYYVFDMSVSNTSDWVRVQIDEVVFGSDQPLPQAHLPENAPYRFTPDTVDLHEDFETLPYQQYLVQGAGYVSQANGVLSFRVPAGEDNQSIRLEIPGKPIDEDNYYATRFRFTSPDIYYWANWDRFSIALENKSFQYPDEHPLEIGVSHQNLIPYFHGQYDVYGLWTLNAYNQGAQAGNWHTLEMVIKPPDDSSQQYTIFFWVDSYLLGEGKLQDPAPFLDDNAPLVVTIQINNGTYRHDVLSGEIDDLVIGTIAGDKIKE